jgi:tRNA 2-thiouridine synthesizing protein E
MSNGTGSRDLFIVQDCRSSLVAMKAAKQARRMPGAADGALSAVIHRRDSMKASRDLDAEFDPDGFIKDPTNWDRELAQAVASREGLAPLGEDHWRLIDALRRRYFETGSVPVMRHMCRDAGLETHCVSDLLDDPRRAWRIAGLPNPGEEAKAYIDTADIPD